MPAEALPGAARHRPSAIPKAQLGSKWPNFASIHVILSPARQARPQHLIISISYTRAFMLGAMFYIRGLRVLPIRWKGLLLAYVLGARALWLSDWAQVRYS